MTMQPKLTAKVQDYDEHTKDYRREAVANGLAETKRVLSHAHDG
jgi:hypothetical protein